MMPEKNKILYIANFRIPTEKAHGFQVVKMCEAFGKKADVILILPKRLNHIKDNLFSFYGVSENFKVVYLPTLDFVGKIPRLGFLLQSFIFSQLVKRYIDKIDYNGVIYSRDQFSLWTLRGRAGIRLIYELHDYPKKLQKLHKQLFNKMKFVCISNGLKNRLMKDGVSSKDILVAPDGVDLAVFDRLDISKEEARKKINLPLDKKIAMYTGHLYSWKGAHVLAEASKFLNNGILNVFVGGTDRDIIDFKNKFKYLKNVLIIGRVDHSQIPLYLKSADVLVLPNSGQIDISRYYTSPIKLFEYMASYRPIIASALPSIEEILDTNNSILVKSDDSFALAESINKVLEDFDLGCNISKNAFEDVKKYSWDKRVENILNFIK